MRVNKTSKADFELFKRVAKTWLKILGLTHYRVSFDHLEESEFEEEKSRAFARIKAPLATCTLTKDWVEDEVTRERVIICAIHEVLHILLDDLLQKGLDRGFNKEDFQKAEEQIIIRLMNGFTELGITKDA